MASAVEAATSGETSPGGSGGIPGAVAASGPLEGVVEGPYKRQAFQAFVLTYAAHTSIHLARKAFAASHEELEDYWGFDAEFLGILDTTFMIAYGIGLIVTGQVSGYLDPVMHLSFGLAGTAVSLALFGMSALIGIKGQNYAWYLIIIILFALFQSVSIPVSVWVVSGWFSHDSHGKVFGVWSTTAIVGNLLGLATASLIAFFSAENTALLQMLLIPSFLVLVMSLLIFYFLQISPNAPAPSPAEDSVPIADALAVPWVKTYTLAFSCVRTVDVSLFFWTVLYLHESLGLSAGDAALVAMTYDGGLMIGGFFTGYITDNFGGTRSGMFAVSLILAATTALGTGYGQLVAVVAVTIFLLGINMGGPVLLMPTAVAADLGLNSRKDVTRTIVGIIDGSGSLCAALGQLAVGYASGKLGWTTVFLLLAGLLLVGSLLCLSIYMVDVDRKFELVNTDDYVSDEERVHEDTACIANTNSSGGDSGENNNETAVLISRDSDSSAEPAAGTRRRHIRHASG